MCQRNRAYVENATLRVDLAKAQQITQFYLQGIISWYVLCDQLYGLNIEEADEMMKDIIEDQYLRTDYGREEYFQNKESSCKCRNRSRY